MQSYPESPVDGFPFSWSCWKDSLWIGWCWFKCARASGITKDFRQSSYPLSTSYPHFSYLSGQFEDQGQNNLQLSLGRLPRHSSGRLQSSQLSESIGSGSQISESLHINFSPRVSCSTFCLDVKHSGFICVVRLEEVTLTAHADCLKIASYMDSKRIPFCCFHKLFFTKSLRQRQTKSTRMLFKPNTGLIQEILISKQTLFCGNFHNHKRFFSAIKYHLVQSERKLLFASGN